MHVTQFVADVVHVAHALLHAWHCAAEPLSLTDLTGQVQAPLDPRGRSATVIVFTLPECPIANAFVPEINRLAADYRAKGVSFFLVHAERELTAATARQHAKEFGVTCPVLVDAQHALVKALGGGWNPTEPPKLVAK